MYPSDVPGLSLPVIAPVPQYACTANSIAFAGLSEDCEYGMVYTFLLQDVACLVTRTIAVSMIVYPNSSRRHLWRVKCCWPIPIMGPPFALMLSPLNLGCHSFGVLDYAAELWENSRRRNGTPTFCRTRDDSVYHRKSPHWQLVRTSCSGSRRHLFCLRYMPYSFLDLKYSRFLASTKPRTTLRIAPHLRPVVLDFVPFL